MIDRERKDDIRRSIQAILTGSQFTALDANGKPKAGVTDHEFLQLALSTLRSRERRIDIEPTSIELGSDGRVAKITLSYSDKDTDESHVITVSYS
jgi:hypothetical protein